MELTLFNVFVVLVSKVYDLSICFAPCLAIYDRIMMNEKNGISFVSACTYKHTTIYIYTYYNHIIIHTTTYSIHMQSSISNITYRFTNSMNVVSPQLQGSSCQAFDARVEASHQEAQWTKISSHWWGLEILCRTPRTWCQKESHSRPPFLEGPSWFLRWKWPRCRSLSS